MCLCDRMKRKERKLGFYVVQSTEFRLAFRHALSALKLSIIKLHLQIDVTWFIFLSCLCVSSVFFFVFHFIYFSTALALFWESSLCTFSIHSAVPNSSWLCTNSNKTLYVQYIYLYPSMHFFCLLYAFILFKTYIISRLFCCPSFNVSLCINSILTL